MEEIWKPVGGYEGLYEVSNLGRVKSLPKIVRGRYNKICMPKKGGLLKALINKNYFKVHLSKENQGRLICVHHLVWDAFGDKPRNGRILMVDHIDNNKLNNRIDNLQLLTNRQNVTKAVLFKGNKSSRYVGVSRDKQRGKYEAYIHIGNKRVYLGRYPTEELASQAYQNALEGL